MLVIFLFFRFLCVCVKLLSTRQMVSRSKNVQGDKTSVVVCVFNVIKKEQPSVNDQRKNFDNILPN